MPTRATWGRWTEHARLRRAGPGHRGGVEARDFDERASPRRRGGGAAGAAGASGEIAPRKAVLGARRAGSARPARPDGDLRRAADHRVPGAALLHRDAALWTEGSTVIHRHPFSGAFQVPGRVEPARPLRLRRAPPGERAFLVGDLSLSSRRRTRAAPSPRSRRISSTASSTRRRCPPRWSCARAARPTRPGVRLPRRASREDLLATRDEVTVRRRQAMRFRAARVSSEYPALAASVLAGSWTCTRPTSCSADAFHGGGGSPGLSSPRLRRRHEEAPRRRRLTSCAAGSGQQLRGPQAGAAPRGRAGTRGGALFLARRCSATCPDRRGHLRGGPRDAARLRSARGRCSAVGPLSATDVDRPCWTSPDPLNLMIPERRQLDGCSGEALQARLGERV